MKSFAEEIRSLRLGKGVPLRLVSAFLNIDQAILSKIERGQRKATRVQVVKLAQYYKIKEDSLILSWLSDKLVNEIKDEKLALKGLQVAEEIVNYKTSLTFSKSKIINAIKTFLKNDGRVAKAWIFGSFARGDYNIESDIDLMVRFKKPDKISLFDYADIAYLLEQITKMKIDLVEEGYLMDFARNTANNDLRAIYG